MAYATSFRGDANATVQTATRDERGWFSTTYRVRARADRPYRVTHIYGIGPQPVARPARRTGWAACGPRRARDSTAAGRESSRLERPVERPDHARRRRRAVAGDHRREPLLPAELGPSVVAREHVAVRARLLAELPLLPRPRDVGHRDVHGAAAALARAGCRAGAARLPARHLEPARQNAALHGWRRRDVSVGELPDPRRGGDAGRAAIHGGSRQPGHRPRVRLVCPCHWRPGLRPTDRVARAPSRWPSSWRPG